MGPYHTASFLGCHYFLCVVDDFSRAVWLFLLKDKSETGKFLKYLCFVAQTQFGHSVQRIRSYNGTEFKGRLQTYFF